MADRGRPKAKRKALEAAWVHEWQRGGGHPHGATARAMQATGRSRSQVKRDVAELGVGTRRAQRPWRGVAGLLAGLAGGAAQANAILDHLAPVGSSGDREWVPGFAELEELPWAAAVEGWRAMERRARRRKVTMAWVVRDRTAKRELLQLIHAAADR